MDTQQSPVNLGCSCVGEIADDGLEFGNGPSLFEDHSEHIHK